MIKELLAYATPILFILLSIGAGIMYVRYRTIYYELRKRAVALGAKDDIEGESNTLILKGLLTRSPFYTILKNEKYLLQF